MQAFTLGKILLDINHFCLASFINRIPYIFFTYIHIHVFTYDQNVVWECVGPGKITHPLH